MKHFVSILFVLASMNVFAQNWAPFPLSETSEWRISIEGFGQCNFPNGGPIDHNYRMEYSMVIADTIEENGHEYYQMMVTGMSNTACPEPCASELCPTTFMTSKVRAEDGVYYRVDFWGDETVVADFNREVGDTVFLPYGIIDSIDQVVINGHSCVRQWLSHDTAWQESLWVIEGVGSNIATFFGYNSHTLQNVRLCYRENGVPVMVNGEDIAVCEITGVEEERKSGLSLYPNPSTGIFNLDLQQQYSFQVYDLFGKLVLEGNGSGQTSIDLTVQPSGIYLLKIDSENGTSSISLAKQ